MIITFYSIFFVSVAAEKNSDDFSPINLKAPHSNLRFSSLQTYSNLLSTVSTAESFDQSNKDNMPEKKIKIFKEAIIEEKDLRENNQLRLLALELQNLKEELLLDSYQSLSARDRKNEEGSPFTPRKKSHTCPTSF